MSDISVSWVILTFNRGAMVKQAIEHCMANAGDTWEELVWVDNGSTDGLQFNIRDKFNPDVLVLNAANRGVARGYNQAMGLASKDYILITGCDMLMPDNWLKTFKEYVRRIPNTGVACMYSKEMDAVPERLRGSPQTFNGLPIVHAMPIERRIFKRTLLKNFGYFPETFGLYGYDDMAWAYRAESTCREEGWPCYMIPNQVAVHLGTEGINPADGKDDIEYHAFKRREALDPAKQAELRRLRAEGFPRFSPYP